MITIDRVSKTYAAGHQPALDDVSIQIDRGDFVFLVGSSGSGKSTLLKLMLREERPSRGDVFVAGRHVNKIPNWRVPGLRRDIGAVFQDFRLLPGKTVFDNVAFALEVIGKRRHDINTSVPEILELVGLEGKERRYPHELSGGEQQRVAVARALAGPREERPRLVVASLIALLQPVPAAREIEAEMADAMEFVEMGEAEGEVCQDEPAGGMRKKRGELLLQRLLPARALGDLEAQAAKDAFELATRACNRVQGSGFATALHHAQVFEAG